MLPGAKSFLSVLVHAGVVRVEELTEPFSTHIPVCSDDITVLERWFLTATWQESL